MSGKILSFTANKAAAAELPSQTLAKSITKNIMQELLAQADSSSIAKKDSAIIYDISDRIARGYSFKRCRVSFIFTMRYIADLLSASSSRA